MTLLAIKTQGWVPFTERISSTFNLTLLLLQALDGVYTVIDLLSSSTQYGILLRLIGCFSKAGQAPDAFIHTRPV